MIYSSLVVEEAIKAARDKGIIPTVILSGTAQGVDTLGEQWAEKNGVPVERYPADWARYGKSAGHKRNRDMGMRADALIAVWDGESPGTRGMIEFARGRGLKVSVTIVELRKRGKETDAGPRQNRGRLGQRPNKENFG